MEKWNYLTYNRTCHDSFPNHPEKSEVFVDQSEAISVAINVEAHESSASASGGAGGLGGASYHGAFTTGATQELNQMSPDRY